jgi:hypothetical protein
MAVAHYLAGDSCTTVDTGLNDGGVITLTGAGVNTGQRITDILIKCLGTITVVDVLVTKNDGSTILAKFGATSALPVGGGVYSFSSPINCVVNDNAKITVTVTGGTAGSLAITANYKFFSK